MNANVVASSPVHGSSHNSSAAGDDFAAAQHSQQQLRNMQSFANKTD
jgi:hypothetical protein